MYFIIKFYFKNKIKKIYFENIICIFINLFSHSLLNEQKQVIYFKRRKLIFAFLRKQIIKKKNGFHK